MQQVDSQRGSRGTGWERRDSMLVPGQKSRHLRTLAQHRAWREWAWTQCCRAAEEAAVRREHGAPRVREVQQHELAPWIPVLAHGSCELGRHRRRGPGRVNPIVLPFQERHCGFLLSCSVSQRESELPRRPLGKSQCGEPGGAWPSLLHQHVSRYAGGSLLHKFLF